MSASQALAVPNEALILCYYFNSTNKIQILRVHSGDCPSFQKIVFPQQRFLFQAPPQAELAIYIEQGGKQVLQERSPCQSRQALAHTSIAT